jgi:hypothetical protein
MKDKTCESCGMKPITHPKEGLCENCWEDEGHGELDRYLTEKYIQSLYDY